MMKNFSFFLEIYFDCVEQTDDHQLVELFPIRQQPWIGEIWLTVYRKYEE